MLTYSLLLQISPLNIQQFFDGESGHELFFSKFCVLEKRDPEKYLVLFGFNYLQFYVEQGQVIPNCVILHHHLSDKQKINFLKKWYC